MFAGRYEVGNENINIGEGLLLTSRCGRLATDRAGKAGRKGPRQNLR